MNNWHIVEITSIETIAIDTVCVTLTRPLDFKYVAGQYVVVHVKVSDEDTLLRQYSFSSPPTEDHLQFIIRNQRGSKASNWFCKSATKGMHLQISDPLGAFAIDRKRPALLIAGGVGITPFLSILRENQFNTTLIYSERSADRLCYADELHSLLPSPMLKIIESNIEGRLTTQNLQSYITDNQIVYICGSFQFVTDVTKLALSAGVKLNDIATEAFTLKKTV